MTAALAPAEVLLAFTVAGGFFAATAVVIEIISRWKSR